MSGKLEKIRVTKQYDRRIKIEAHEHEIIIRKHNQGQSIHSLSRDYGVNKRLIQFILFPERKRRSLELRAERGGSKKYYDKEKCKLSMRQHRAYKRSLYKAGKIKI